MPNNSNYCCALYLISVLITLLLQCPSAIFVQLGAMVPNARKLCSFYTACSRKSHKKLICNGYFLNVLVSIFYRCVYDKFYTLSHCVSSWVI